MTTLGLGLGRALGPLGMPTTASKSTAFPAGLSDQLILVDTAVPAIAPTLTDSIGINNLTTVIYQQLVVASESLGLTLTMTTINGIVLTEVLRLAPSALANQITQVTASDIIAVLAQLYPGIPASLTESIGLTITQTVQQAILVAEELGLTESMIPAAKYQLSYTDTMGLAASLANFFGGTLTENLGLTATMVGNMLLDQTLSESVGLGETYTANLIFRITATEDIGFDETNILQAIYRGTISEEVEITAAYLSPGGGFTTWAMNTRTAAVTEYSNYEFTGFAQMGNKYLGTSATGLYELNGDDDDGDAIVADIKSGFAQFAGTKHTLFKSIYLGVRGDGDFVFRVVSGEGQTYDYAVATRDMRSTKVHLGKGLRARYFSFELISEGQDFDLDTIEFVPLVAQRRV